MHWCKKNHKTILGCVVGVILFILLHLAGPSLLFLPLLWNHEARAESDKMVFNEVFNNDGVVVYRTWLSHRDCLVGIANGRMAKTVTIECLER